MVSLIAPNEVPNLEVLKLGGEALTRDNIAIWADKVKLSNSYGVAECAIRSVYRQDITPDTDFTDCGSAVGSCVWITNPDNFEELTPIGGTGELLIEGPTVARGYLGDPEKTRKAFVSPSWLNALFPGRKCRVYRTGDLVKYGVDGTIRFVGRSDSQIKIRGQRCELREIEHHLCVDPGVGLAATAVPSEGPYRGRLVAVIAFQDALTQDTQLTLCTSKHRSELAAKLAGLHEILTEKVPAYMVPTVWIPVTCLPINPSGKLNRISINRWLGSMNDGDQQVVSALSADQTPESDKSAASTLSETAEFLRTIWARVLNYPVDQIAPGTSFFRIGGDSISAMQVAALCRGHQIQITMQDVMHLKTLNRLATGCESRRAPKLDTATVNREKYNEPFLLSPIQSIFFDLMPDGTNGYSLGVCLRACTHVPANAIAEAIAFVTQRHSMLRARFQKHSGQWTQKILNPSATAHAFDTYRLPPTADYTNVLSATREKLDFTNGPVFAAAYIDRGENEQILFLTAHHLVVDVVSWRVIVQDLENSIRGAGQPSLTSMPFQAWLEKQRHQAVENRLASKKATLLPQPSPSYWGLMPQQNLSSDAIEQSFSLSERASAYIFAQASSGLRLDPVDILVGTLAFSFSRVFRDRLPITIDNEGHGREPWDPSIDLSSTVGWFSTRYPLRVDDRARESLSECIRCMRQLRRSSPDNGRQFFSEQCYCHPEEKAEMMSEMSFNYLGQSQPSETPDSLFENLGYRAGNDLSMRRFALIEMDAIAQDGRFTFTYEYPKGIKHRDRIQQWLSLFAQTLETLNAKLTTAPPEPTLSDFHLNLSSEDFESLITTVLPSAGIPSARYVEDMYRCSPTQQGIFLSQLQNPERYNVVSYFKVYPSPCDDTICLDRMEDAWRALVARHQILRTIIVSAMAEGQSLIQVVLDECRVRTAQFETSTESEAYETLKSKRPLISIYEQPLHALSMCTVDNAGYAIFKLEISHALIDAASNGVLFADLERAYSGQLVQDMNPAFSSYVAKIAETSEDDSLKYWKNYLSGTSPCIFPRLTHELSEHVTVNYLVPFSDHARLHDFCTRREITTATVYQLAWAMLLKAFIGTESVCFGFLASGRDMDIPGIHDSIGPYINMLVSRVELDLSLSIHETLQNLQQRTLQSLSNQFTSLSQICHALNLGGGQQLFNTVLSVQRGISTRGIEKADCTICDMEMSDPTEFDITVNVIDSHDQHTACLTVQQSTVPEWLAQHLAYTLSQILQSIIGQDHSNSVSDIQALSSQDKNQILSWNATNPAKVDRCTHDLVADQMILLPNALAVSAWDGDFTYAELDTLSAGYASALISRGVGPETFVPFCMEKTRWSVVAILSIMRAGGACVPLDPGHPRERIQAMVDQLSPPVVVVSEAQVQHCSGLTDGIVIMGDNCPMDPTVHSHELVDVKPSNACYVIFTSGSTGVPKGVVWNHSTLASSVVAHGLALKYEQRSRMLQFAAHVFDISVSEFITPLVYGKCVVIPSDENRMKDIEGFITERKVDWAFLTPTVARLIDPNLVPTLKTLVLGGESIGQDNVQKWSQRLQMMIIWGPCETCKFAL